MYQIRDSLFLVTHNQINLTRRLINIINLIKINLTPILSVVRLNSIQVYQNKIRNLLGKLKIRLLHQAFHHNLQRRLHQHQVRQRLNLQGLVVSDQQIVSCIILLLWQSV